MGENFPNGKFLLFLKLKKAKISRTGKFVDFNVKKGYNFTERENFRKLF